jgi:hypothetical protein
MLVGLFVLLCGLYGAGMGKFDIWGKEQIPAFFAIRPMSTPRFVVVKMLGATLSALIAWSLLLLLVSIWATVEASQLNPNQSIVRAAFAQASLRDCVAFALIAVGMLAYASRNLVIGMWVSLAGRKVLAMAIGFLCMLLFAVAGLAGHWLYHHREYVPDVLTYLPWLFGALLLVRLALASWVVHELRRRALASPKAIWRVFGIWAALCGVLATITYCFVNLTPLTAMGIMMAVPIVRIVAAPLCLHWNRHR